MLSFLHNPLPETGQKLLRISTPSEAITSRLVYGKHTHVPCKPAANPVRQSRKVVLGTTWLSRKASVTFRIRPHAALLQQVKFLQQILLCITNRCEEDRYVSSTSDPVQRSIIAAATWPLTAPSRLPALSDNRALLTHGCTFILLVSCAYVSNTGDPYVSLSPCGDQNR